MKADEKEEGRTPSSAMRPAPLEPRARAAAEIERELKLQAEASDTPERAVS